MCCKTRRCVGRDRFRDPWLSAASDATLSYAIGRHGWDAANELGEAPEVLRGGGEQHFIPRTAQPSQSKPIEPENALHVRKPHLDLLALAA
jgi:hypothetical protein